MTNVKHQKIDDYGGYRDSVAEVNDLDGTWPTLTPSKEFKLTLNLGTPAAQQLRPPLETTLPPCVHIKGRS